MIKETKTRITITIPNSLDDDLNTLCGQMGVSKSQFICMALGEKVMAYKKSFEIAADVLKVSQNIELIKPIS